MKINGKLQVDLLKKTSVNIDYMSISRPRLSGKNFKNDGQSIAWEVLPDYFDYCIKNRYKPASMTPRAPFNRAINWGGVGVLWHDKNDGVLIEIAGTACSIIGNEYLIGLIRAGEKITRVDIAMDIETDETPFDACQIAKARTTSQFVTDTGVTLYYGSMKSDVYTRVYKYNPPHPRAHLLRFETVYRRKTLPAILAGLLDGRIMDIVATRASKLCFAPRGVNWDYCPMERIFTPESKQNNTVLWFKKQVAPAFRKLVETGEIKNPVQWLEEIFLINL